MNSSLLPPKWWYRLPTLESARRTTSAMLASAKPCSTNTSRAASSSARCVPAVRAHCQEPAGFSRDCRTAGSTVPSAGCLFQNSILRVYYRANLLETEGPVFEVRRGQDVPLIGEAQVGAPPRQPVALPGHPRDAAHQVTRVEVGRVGPRPQRHA